MHLCLHLCVCWHAYVPGSFLQNWNGGQRATVEVSSFPPTTWVLGLNSCHQTWQQAPIPTRLPHQPALRPRNVGHGFTDDGGDAFSLNSFPKCQVQGQGRSYQLTSQVERSAWWEWCVLTGPQWQRQRETGLKCSYQQTQAFHHKARGGDGAGDPFPARLESERQAP